MEEFLEQIEKAMENGQFYLALFCSLTLPDICGAISSENGEANNKKYKDWFDKYISPKYDGNFDGNNCYAFRCAALHQGRTEHKKLNYKRIIFIDPVSSSEVIMHNNILNDALNIDTREFCKDIIQGVRDWLNENSKNSKFQKNYSTFLRRHKGGIKHYISGVDVFSS